MSVLNENVIIGASAQGGYEIPNSLRFNDDDSAYLSRTPSGAGNQKTWTWSGWVKRGDISGASLLFSAGTATGNQVRFYIGGGNNFNLDSYVSGAYSFQVYSSLVLRDPSAWYHLFLAFDTTQATASNRVKVYVNGVQVSSFITSSYPSLNLDSFVNNTDLHYVGNGPDNYYLDGYLSEVNFIDGQALTPDDFGETGDYGEWIPKKYIGTYGTNGFYLDFKDSGSLGNDAAGSNNWTPTNLAATDQMLDSPTNNFAVMNPLDSNGVVFSEGNTKLSGDGVNGWNASRGTVGISSGKWYWEVNPTAIANSVLAISIATYKSSLAELAGQSSSYGVTYYPDGRLYKDSSSDGSYGAAYAVGDIISIALDMGTGTVTFYKNNVSQGVASSILLTQGDTWFPSFAAYYASTTSVTNFGQDSSFAGNKTAQGNSDANGIGDFYYAPPTGYLALCTNNLPDATVVPSEHFNTVLYTGNGVDSRAVTGVGFAPDLNWIKARTEAHWHVLTDTVRGAGKSLYSNATNAENTDNLVETLDSDGFTVDINAAVNNSGKTYVAWNWKAGGTGVSNTDGTITSTVSANVDAGFSIVSYTGNSSAGATIGHGLSVAPELVIVKTRDVVLDWFIYCKELPTASYTLSLNLTSAQDSSNLTTWNGTAPSSSLITLGSSDRANATSAMIAYAFHSVDGYSKVGSYTGNGSADGTFVYLGFRPAYVMQKRTDVANDWGIYDADRDTYNVGGKELYANLSSAEASAVRIDFTSNGFKLRASNNALNASGGTYIYIAFAESPFKHSNAR